MATIAPCRYSEAEGLVKQVYEEIMQAYKAAYKIKAPRRSKWNPLSF